MLIGDTIVAISTPPGRGGIGVVRISGPDSLKYANEIFRAQTRADLGQPNRAVYGSIADSTGEGTLDEAVATTFRAPHSYTGEDVVELSCHGSPVVLRQIIELIVNQGGRIAEPGEFTFRAFLNHRIDLAQAQAVRDLINAQTQYQAVVATRQLDGSLSRRLAPIKESLIEIIVQQESSLEFVEDDISTESIAALVARMDRIVDSLEVIKASFSLGRYIREGFDLAIVGRPNVGKSSVFNRLIGTDRAIVTEVPGTTRDALYESTSISGVPVRLIDTAGIRDTSDIVETIGIARSRAAIADADVVLLVIDQSQPLSADDQQLLERVDHQRRIIALNKNDLAPALGPIASEERLIGSALTKVSALTGLGFEQLTDEILKQLTGNQVTDRNDIILTDARQHSAIGSALKQISDARRLLTEHELTEIVLLKLHGSLSSLGEVTGETLTEDILGQIFSTFCIGK